LLCAAGPVVGLLVLLVPTWFSFAQIVKESRLDPGEPCVALEFPSLPVFSPRPPPVR
jgi:hypothetical protein